TVEPSPAIPVNEARSPYAPYRVASRGGNGSAIAFIRDPKTTLQVWSRDHGYPGEYAYLEFHKKHFPGGLRFWRITDHKGDRGTAASNAVAAGGLVGRGRRPPRVAEPRHGVDVGPRVQRGGGVGRAPEGQHRRQPRPRARAGAGDARAVAPAGLGLAVPHHHR